MRTKKKQWHWSGKTMNDILGEEWSNFHTFLYLTQSRPPKKTPHETSCLTTDYIKKTQRTCQASNIPCAHLHRSVPALQENRLFPVVFHPFPAMFGFVNEPAAAGPILGLVSTRRHVLRKLHVENLLLGLGKEGKPVDSWGAAMLKVMGLFHFFWGGGGFGGEGKQYGK